MQEQVKLPTFGFRWTGYLKKPWRLRWRILPLPYYYGRQFRKYRKLLNRSLYWTTEQIKEYQWKQLKQLVDHAYHTTRFYRKQFETLKITPADIRSFSDFSQLPTINRTHLRDNLADFVSSEFIKYRGTESKTSGTTGNVLKFYRSLYVEGMRQAVEWRHLNQIGYKYKQPAVSLKMSFTGDESNLLYKYDALGNVVMLNGRMITVEHGRLVHDLFKQFKPIMLTTHPSAAIALGTVIKRLGLEPLDLPIVCVVSEALDSRTSKRIASYVGPRIYDHYGNRENTISASQLHCGHYHINSEFVYMEMTEDNKQVLEGKYFRVIGTCLYNYAMPLIRYDCDDLAHEIQPCPNPECGNHHPTIRFIGGREKNFIVTKGGLLYCEFDDRIVYQKYDFLEEYQIIQTSLDSLTLKIVPASNYDRERDEKLLLELLDSTTRNMFKLSIEYVNAIPRTKTFKKSRIVSHLADKDLADN